MSPELFHARNAVIVVRGWAARQRREGRSEIGAAFREFGATLATGTAWTIRATAFLLPLALVGFMLFAALRALWRRRRRG